MVEDVVVVVVEEREMSGKTNLEELWDQLHYAIRALKALRFDNTMRQKAIDKLIALQEKESIASNEECIAREVVQEATLELSLGEARLQQVLVESAGHNASEVEDKVWETMILGEKAVELERDTTQDVFAPVESLELAKPCFPSPSLAFLISVATLAKFNYITPLRFSDRFCNYHGSFDGDNYNIGSQMRKTIETAIFKIHQEMDDLKALEANSSTPPSSVSSASGSMFRHVAFLADVLSLVQSVHMELPSFEERSVADHPLKQQKGDPGEHFMREEIKKYIKIKPNRLGKQNFMGANGTFTSIGHACFAMKKDLEEYMDYDVGEICNDDWRLAQKLMVHGCDPLPRRRCFSRGPQLYHKPFPINESLWKLPDNRNVRWGQYKCKNFACLASNTTARKGFFKCTDCFNLTHHESPRWLNRGEIDPETNQTADFSIAEVLEIKPGEIRIGLDFSIGTGTFAARMREQNVTIVSATINLGAPFNEMIALRGLVPLYLTVNQRLPFFDSTLDMIHTTRFLDGWIDLILLDFVLFDWDRVLRPGGLLWIDGFFCLKEDVSDYMEAFKALRYRKHKWVVVPKKDKDDKEVFFSAVLEKPPRPFR
uniref:A_IG002N01.7 protein n=1 Tax=Arabidopsis thaliana TaxID=3702 RepID=O04610_ARATH|nr:A_IG002N01.7 gene product [Arabidopsis thaliana]